MSSMLTTSRPILRTFLTARDGVCRLTELPHPSGDSGGSGPNWIRVDTGTTFQTLEGFGGAFTEAAAVTWLKLSPERRGEVLRAYFDRQSGHGYSLCRVPMGSCDFALGNHAHAETPEDFALASFSIARDRQALVPFIRAAQQAAGEPLKLLASPWSPPAWMKTNGHMNRGGALRADCRRAWARCYARFIDAYAAEGIPIWGVSVQNEPMATQPWESCLYTAEEERDFVRDWLGPELLVAGLGHIKIVIWDHNRDLMVERSNVIYSDAEAARFAWGTGFHWYGEDHFDHVQQVHEAWPEKHLLFTEGCQEGGPHLDSWELGERYAHSMINDLNRWTEGWIDWNLMLDDQGGPNHLGNFCSAPVLIDAARDALLPQSSYFYLGHFTRFLKVGAQRVLCTATEEGLETTAFVNPDGSLALVVLNRSEQEKTFQLSIDGGQASAARLPPRSIATYLA
jgi:glucosylceramidase